MQSIDTILKDTFGYHSFRPLQREIIEAVIGQNDTLAVLPTGAGKSLCYQIPALVLPGLTIVISPLISLMKDQVDQARASGVAAIALNSSLSAGEYRAQIQALLAGEVKLLYLSPEAVLSDRFQTLFDRVKVDLLTIDEAHCISEWGHDFRPEYRQLAALRKKFPQATCLALTATATQRVRQDIRSTLNFQTGREFVASFNRANLFLQVEPKEDAEQQVLRFIRRHRDQSGIIYCFSRQQVDTLCERLQREGISARPYHAGLDESARRLNQDAFVRDDIMVIVATIAFGMGINKPNVRFVIHYDLPKSIENYYQEIGRAGRDGLPAHCLLLYSYGDAAKQRFFINQKRGQEKTVAGQHLEQMVRYAENNQMCRRRLLLTYFGEQVDGNSACAGCDICAPLPAALENITIPAQKYLSCALRCEENFSAEHLVAVLCGVKNAEVSAHQHERLSTYAIGFEYTEQEWLALAADLERIGYTQTGTDRSVHVTTLARAALKNRTAIFRPEPGKAINSEKIKIQKPPAEKSPAQPAEMEYNQALYFALRQKRKELADAAQVPPYVIFSDRSLMEMAAHFPRSEKTFLRIHGVGKVKAEKYGPIFTTLIRQFCRSHPGVLPKKIQER
ncbi:MAG TPA: DNA helicase RecQ [Bellilinea sp.]|nr:DNA helicase RecQ [Bellilinea sp.]